MGSLFQKAPMISTAALAQRDEGSLALRARSPAALRSAQVKGW
jgi:hypothetical protein